MTREQKKRAILSRLILMIIGVVIGALLLVLASVLTETVVGTVIHWVLIVCGILIIIGQVPGLLAGIAHINERAGLLDLGASLLGIMLGILLIFFQNAVLVAVLGACLILLPILRLVFSPDRKKRLVPELIRIILGVLVLLFLPALTSAAFRVLQIVLTAAGWVLIGLSVILFIVMLVRIALGKEEMPAPKKGGNVYVDYTGDGKVDTIYMDTTGDGIPDTEYKVDKHQK